jgi:hypothetical protein
VVGVDVDVPGAVAENDGSTKYRGASWVSLNWRATYVTARTRIPITARPRTLAPRTVEVRLCQGVGDEALCSPS